MTRQTQTPHQKLASQLKAARLTKRITVTKASRALRITVKQFELLESGEVWKHLDRPLWVSHYKNFASLVGLNDSKIAPYLSRATDKKYQLQPRALDLKKTKKIVVLNQWFKGLFYVALVAVVLIYTLRQTSVLWSAPPLTLDWPVTNPYISASEIVSISGRTSPEATLLIGGDPLPVDDDGSFSAPLILQPGKNIVTIEVRNNIRGYRVERLTLYGPDDVDLQR